MELLQMSDASPPNEYQKSRCTWTQVFVAIALALLAASVIAIPPPSDADALLFGGILVGVVLGGLSIDYLGRKKTIVATAIARIVACLLITYSDNNGILIAAQIINYFCDSVTTIAVPIYLCETIQPEVRGTLALLPKAFIVIGLSLRSLAFQHINWPLGLVLGAIISVLSLISMVIIPDTPRWFVLKVQQERARKALQWLRGKKTDIEPELKDIMKSHADAVRQKSEICIVQLLKYNLKPFLIALGLMFLIHFCGIRFLMFDVNEIFMGDGSKLNINWFVMGGHLLGTLIAMSLIDLLGRKILLYISFVGMIVAFASIGGYIYMQQSGQNVSHIGWLATSSFICATFSFSLGIGSLPFLIMAEILPTKNRGSAASLVGAFNCLCMYFVFDAPKYLLAIFGRGGSYWFSGVVCVLGLVFVIYCLPETNGKTLEDIELEFKSRERRMSSVDNIGQREER